MAMSILFLFATSRAEEILAARTLVFLPYHFLHPSELLDMPPAIWTSVVAVMVLIPPLMHLESVPTTEKVLDPREALRLTPAVIRVAMRCRKNFGRVVVLLRGAATMIHHLSFPWDTKIVPQNDCQAHLLTRQARLLQKPPQRALQYSSPKLHGLL